MKFVRGCREIHRQRVRLQSQKDNRGIALSLIQVGEQFYLSGHRFVYENEETIQIGYPALTGQSFKLGSRSLTGVRLAIGPKGIQGLQLITDGANGYSRWFGPLGDLLGTGCLVSQGLMSAIKVGLDASICTYIYGCSTDMSLQSCKIVAVSVLRDLVLPRSIIAGNIRNDCQTACDKLELGFPSFHRRLSI